MLSFQTVFPDTLELLKKLSQEPLLQDTRLVGGTALALQYGHRSSIDLDFFGKIHCSNDELLNALKKYGKVNVRTNGEAIRRYFISDICVDIVSYPYNWIDAPCEEDGIILASPKDIAALKMNAIINRGTKKDFIDIYELLKHFSLNDIFIFSQQKFPEFSLFRAMLSLSYFEDAEGQPMPTMFIPDKWENMKEKILLELRNLNFESLE